MNFLGVNQSNFTGLKSLYPAALTGQFQGSADDTDAPIGTLFGRVVFQEPPWDRLLGKGLRALIRLKLHAGGYDS